MVKVQDPYVVLLLGHLRKNQFCVFMVKIQQLCTIYQNKMMVDDLRHSPFLSSAQFCFSSLCEVKSASLQSLSVSRSPLWSLSGFVHGCLLILATSVAVSLSNAATKRPLGSASGASIWFGCLLASPLHNKSQAYSMPRLRARLASYIYLWVDAAVVSALFHYTFEVPLINWNISLK